MFSSISVAIPRGKTGFLVALFSLILLGTVLTSLTMGDMNIPVFDSMVPALSVSGRHLQEFPAHPLAGNRKVVLKQKTETLPDVSHETNLGPGIGSNGKHSPVSLRQCSGQDLITSDRQP